MHRTSKHFSALVSIVVSLLCLPASHLLKYFSKGCPNADAGTHRYQRVMSSYLFHLYDMIISDCSDWLKLQLLTDATFNHLQVFILSSCPLHTLFMETLLKARQ